MRITISPALNDALRSCADIERQIFAIGARVDAQRKLDLVHARRKLAERLGSLISLLQDERALADVPEKREELGRLFSSFRYAIGQHQASWPAVRIEEDVAAYAASARNTHAKSDQFWRWCDQNLTCARD
jgi:hypothetical protein